MPIKLLDMYQMFKKDYPAVADRVTFWTKHDCESILLQLDDGKNLIFTRLYENGVYSTKLMEFTFV